MATENLTKGGSNSGDCALAILAEGDTKTWTPSTGTDHLALLKKGVVSPVVPDITSYVSAIVDGKIDRFTVSNTILSAVTDITVWVYASATTDTKIQVNVFTGGTWGSYSDIVPTDSVAGWYSKTFSGSFAQSDLDALAVGLKNVRATSGTATIYAVYVVVTGSNVLDGTLIIATDDTKPTNAALKAQGWTVTATAANAPASGLAV